MSKYIIDSSTLTGIADAVREKTGSSSLIQVSNLAAAVEDIPTSDPNIEEGQVKATVSSSGGTISSITSGSYKLVGNHVFINAKVQLSGSGNITSISFLKSNGTSFPSGSWMFNMVQPSGSGMLFTAIVLKTDGTQEMITQAFVPQIATIAFSTSYAVSSGSTILISLAYTRQSQTIGDNTTNVQSGQQTMTVYNNRSQVISATKADVTYTRVGTHVWAFARIQGAASEYGQWAKYFPTCGKSVILSSTTVTVYAYSSSTSGWQQPTSISIGGIDSDGTVYPNNGIGNSTITYFYVAEYDLS